MPIVFKTVKLNILLTNMVLELMSGLLTSLGINVQIVFLSCFAHFDQKVGLCPSITDGPSPETSVP